MNISSFPSKHTNNLFDRTQSQHPTAVRFALPKAILCFPLQSLWAAPSLWLCWAGQWLSSSGRDRHLGDSRELSSAWLPTCQLLGDPGEVDTNRTSVYIKHKYKFLPSHLPKLMVCRVRITGILYHRSYCSSCATTEGTRGHLLPQCASSTGSDTHCIQECPASDRQKQGI